MNTEEIFNSFEIDSTNYETRLTKKFLNRKAFKKPDPHVLNAFIPGVIKKLYVSEGNSVDAGDQLLLLEAMKMENTVRSTLKGKIKKISVKEGETVIKNQLLIELE